MNANDMKTLPLILAAVALITGCATHDKQTIAKVRAAGVSGRTIAKLENHGSLTPEDVIELKRRGVADAVPLRQLDQDGVDYIIQRDEIAKLRKAGVRPAVTDAVIAASDRFVRGRYASPQAYWWHDPWLYPPPFYYGDPFWWPYSGVSVGYISGRHRRCR